MPTSQNGWPANNINLTKMWDIPGTDRRIRLERGDAGWMLVHFLEWFHANIEPLDEGIFDDWGYAERPIRGGTALSNHASGTAADANATLHPMGVRNTFTADQRNRIRAKLTEYDGCIRWGGDYVSRPDDMHFEINRNSSVVKATVAKLRRAEMAAEQEIAKLRADLEPVIRHAKIVLDFRGHHGNPADDFVGHILSIRKTLADVDERLTRLEQNS